MVTAPRPTITPAQIRRAAISKLPRLGVILSPEFIAALEPHPREKIVTGGWRGGKSELGFCEFYLPILEDIYATTLGLIEPTPRLYWCIVSKYTAPKKEMDYLAEAAKAGGFLTRYHQPNDDSAVLELYGGMYRYVTKTAQDIPAIAGDACDGVLCVEAGQMMDGIYEQIQGRVLDKRGWIVMSGTIEPTETAPRWLWYEKMADDWAKHPQPGERESYSLPSWANLSVFPYGRQDPEILRIEKSPASLKDKNYFKRRIEGIPTGYSMPIYWQLTEPDSFSFHHPDPTWINGRGAGGHDFGTGGIYNHPSTLVALTMLNKGIANQNVLVVRESWSSLTQDNNVIEYNRRIMGQRYSIPRARWGFDPMQREAADLVGASVFKSRNDKVSMVEARLNRGTLLFDMAPHDSSPAEAARAQSVVAVFEQMQQAHWISKVVVGQGEKLEYDRSDDDLVAALEDAVAVVDGDGSFSFGTPRKFGGMKSTTRR